MRWVLYAEKRSEDAQPLSPGQPRRPQAHSARPRTARTTSEEDQSSASSFLVTLVLTAGPMPPEKYYAANIGSKRWLPCRAGLKPAPTDDPAWHHLRRQASHTHCARLYHESSRIGRMKLKPADLVRKDEVD